MMTHILTVAAMVSTMIAPAPVVAHEPQGQPMSHRTSARLGTEQMYRDYMESGSIYYGDRRAGPPARIVERTKPSMRAIEREARRFAFSSDPYTSPEERQAPSTTPPKLSGTRRSLREQAPG
jgi:hypothetical protein